MLHSNITFYLILIHNSIRSVYFWIYKKRQFFYNAEKLYSSSHSKMLENNIMVMFLDSQFYTFTSKYIRNKKSQCLEKLDQEKYSGIYYLCLPASNQQAKVVKEGSIYLIAENWTIRNVRPFSWPCYNERRKRLTFRVDPCEFSRKYPIVSCVFVE